MRTIFDIFLGVIGCIAIFLVLGHFFSTLTILIIVAVVVLLFYISYFCKDLNRFYNLNFLLRIASSGRKNKKSNAFDIYI